LARCYWEGIGVERDYNEAMKWYEAAAEQGQKSAKEKIDEWKDTWWDGNTAIYSKNREVFKGIWDNYLYEYEIIEGTKYIAESACFDMEDENDCIYLSKLTIPHSVILIGNNPFGCQMSKVVCRSPFFEVHNKTLYTKGKKELIQCFNHEIDEFYIPEGVEVIRNYAFYSCPFKRIVIPSSVKEIGANPFVQTGIREEDKQELEIVSYSSNYIVYKKTLYDGNKIVSYWGNDDFFVVPYGVQIIGNKAFWMSCIKSIYIPNSIKSISEDAFYWNHQLENIKIPFGELQRFKMLVPESMHNLIEETLYGQIKSSENNTDV